MGAKKGASYAQVVSSSSNEGSPRRKTGSTSRMEWKGNVGTKRPRSPCDGACGRCFRTTHATAECRHQVVCLRCSCVGHVAARCPMEDRRNPRRRRVHVRSKQLGKLDNTQGLSTADRRHSEVVSNQRETNDSGASSVVETRLIVKREALSLSLSLSGEL